MIKLTFDTLALVRHFNDVGARQLPFAMALALTRTAQAMQTDEKIELRHAFDRPTPFTVNSVFMRAATKKKLEAFVFLRDEASSGTPPVKYLVPEVYGGRRRVKRFERALQSAGILRSDQLTVPGKETKLNQYGNITGGAITAMLSAVRGSSDPLQNRRRGSSGKKKARQFFAGNIRKSGSAFGSSGVGGIFERKGKGVVPFLLFVQASEVDYSKRYDFFGVIEQVIARGEMQKQFKLALKEARRTARK